MSPPAQGCPGGSPCVPPQGKELPTLKDVDFLNKNEKVFVEEEQQRDFMDKLKRDVEVGVGGCTPRGSQGIQGGFLPTSSDPLASQCPGPTPHDLLVVPQP